MVILDHQNVEISSLPGASGGAVLSARHLHGGPGRPGGLHCAAGAGGPGAAPGAGQEMVGDPGEKTIGTWEKLEETWENHVEKGG